MISFHPWCRSSLPLYRNNSLSARNGRVAKLLTIIPVTGIVGPGATVVPVTIATAATIALLIPGVGPVIASVAVGRCEPRPIFMPIALLVRSTVLIGLVFQTLNVVGAQDAI